jgi:hypothetical protein
MTEEKQMTEKKNKSKLQEIINNHRLNNDKSDKRAQDILSLIRNKKTVATIMFEKAVQHQMMHLSQSDMHRIVAQKFDDARKPDLEDLN